MSSIPPPTKPPRGVKQTRETSGLLMSVIRTLSASETNEQRDREKSKLENEFKRSDRKLDELVAVHDENLTKVMQIFTTLSAQVSTTREKIHAVKENIIACKTLLRCRRDELHKLWFEGVEYKYMLQLLEEIEQMNEVPSQLASFLSKKHYLHATKLLVNAVSLGQGTLDGVEALRELSAELDLKKQQLHVKLLEELSRHLYLRASQEAFQLRRQGSGRDPALLASPFQREAELRASARCRPNTKAKRSLLDVANRDQSDYKIIEHTHGDPEENSSHFMSILVECFVLLDKVNEAVEAIKVNMQSELLAITDRTTKDIEANLVQGNSQNNLLELLETIFDQFRSVAKAHQMLLQHFKKALQAHNIDVKLYEMQDYWSKLQAVLQLLLTNYLDIQNLSMESVQNDVFTESADISSYFSRKKVQSKKKGSLFKFDTPTHGVGNSIIKDAARDREKHFVCTPDPNNIVYIYITLSKFIDEIEEQMELPANEACTLNQFVFDYVSDVYLSRVRSEMSNRVENAVKSSDAWKAVTSADKMRELKVSKPLLESAVLVERCVAEWHELMKALPPHAGRIATATISTLQSYRDACQAAYRGIVQPVGDERRVVCSAAWLKDEDISRFLKTLPNWTNLKTKRHRTVAVNRKRITTTTSTVISGGGGVSGSGDVAEEEEESPADIRQRNLHEAEILASNLGEGGISVHEILSDMSALKCLAQLEETMEWFSDNVKIFSDKIASEPTIVVVRSTSSDSVKMDSVVSNLSNLVQDFDDIADTCLLVLHLEVRVQCFHYLLNKATTGGSVNGMGTSVTDGTSSMQEADPKVQQLGRVLAAIDEAVTSCLQPHKCKYIFEGLGNLIAKILISASQYMDKINVSGIESMCRNVFALQQTLTNITMCREVALDHARHFYELFYLTPDEILANIMEKGPEFSELEYMNAFQLISRSQPGKNSETAVNVHLERLSDILGEVGVTV